ncbi:hypothetical protein C5B85_18310 [Pseudoclavibacter sp. AY1F1]|nr:hypothetical protein C5B85_18310 [Pseudoclavibacter sp. AY1F1]
MVRTETQPDASPCPDCLLDLLPKAFRMRLRSTVSLVVMTLCLTLLSLAALSFQAAQAAVLRESNALYSGRAMVMTGDVAATLTDARASGLDVQIYIELADDPHLRGVVSTGEPISDLLPIHDLRWTVSDERPGAMIGAAHAESAVMLDAGAFAERYEVAGRLGTSDRSLVADDILIYDPALFEAHDPRSFVVDGRDAELVGATIEGARYVDAGLSRRTNVDYVTPIVLGLAAALLILGAALTGYLSAQWSQGRDQVLRLWGQSHPGRLTRRVASVSLVWCAAVMVTAVAAIAVVGAPSWRLLGPFSAAVGTLYLVALVSLIVTVLRVGRVRV